MVNTHKQQGRYGEQRTAYEKNRKRVLMAQTVCGICGREVDKSLKFPHPLSATVDHIIPISQGGHPSDIENLQLAHLSCNQAKYNRISGTVNKEKVEQEIGNRDLPQSTDWTKYEG